MSKSDGKRWVREVPHEPLRYHVESWRSRDPYLVDLTENQGNGECNCADFITRRNIAIRDGAELFSDKTMCVHIKACRRHFVNTTLRAMAHHLNPEEKSHV